MAGVDFAILNDIAEKLTEAPRGIAEKIMTLRICLAPIRYVTLKNVYAPKMTYPNEYKEVFYVRYMKLPYTFRQGTGLSYS